MDRLFAGRITSFLAVIGLAFLLVTSLYGSAPIASLVSFAGQIIQEINGLKTATTTSNLPHGTIRVLNSQLDVAVSQMQKGINYLQRDKLNRAKSHFRLAESSVNRYIDHLSWYQFNLRLLNWSPFGIHHQQHHDNTQWIDALKDEAIKIREHIRQLIRGNISNNAPIANAGPDQSAQVGHMVTLDGSASSDPDGDALQFSWIISSQPAASVVELSDPQVATPAFTPTLAGSYVFELTVSDGFSSSQPDTVTISVAAANTQPIANAGSDQTGVIGETITLDGSASSDADGDNLNFDWTLITVPDGSGSILDDPTNVRPTFIPDLSGLYQARLIVNDGQLDSLEDVVDIQIDNQNTKPVANAGPDQSVHTDQLVQLDGSASTDADGDELNWLWSMISAPTGSNAQLSDNLAVNPTFTTDVAGQYIIQLVVNDGQGNSAPDSVIINALTPNTIPVANAGSDQSDYVGNLVTLDGSASSDADGDSLTYNWSLAAIPNGSDAQLNNPNSVNPSFVIDLPGDYVAQLIVNDGQANSAPDETVVSTLNSRPIANAGDDQTITIGQSAQLHATASSDADNDSLSYIWSISSRPDGSVATLSDTTSAIPVFTPDQIGFYLFQLIVNDGTIDSTPDTIKLQVNPLEDIAIILGEPADQSYTNQESIHFIGSLNHEAELTIDGQPVTVESDLSFDYTATLQEGLNQIVLVATDAVNAQATITRNITLDTSVPNIPVIGLISVSLPDAEGIVTIAGEAGSAEPYAEVVIVNQRTNETLTVTANADGVFSVRISGKHGDAYSIIVQDAAGNQSDPIQTSDGSLPPDPSTVAPPLNPNETTSYSDATSFLYTGTNPIQSGVAADTIVSDRAAVIRGRTLDRESNPLSSVKIEINGHPEFGQTLSRDDGQFDMVVNGGGSLTINYSKDGYLPAQRTIDTPWRDYQILDDVVLIPLDQTVSVIDLSGGVTTAQVARSSVSSDADGERKAIVVFPAGTSATMILGDGTTQNLNTINVLNRIYGWTKWTKGHAGRITAYFRVHLCGRTIC